MKFHGASGNIKFDANGDRMNMTLDIVNLRGNKLKKVNNVLIRKALLLSALQGCLLFGNSQQVHSSYYILRGGMPYLYMILASPMF